MSKPKLLWIGNSPNNYSISSRLIDQCGDVINESFELIVFGIHNHNGYFAERNYKIVDTFDDTGIYGYYKLKLLMLHSSPKMIVICGDIPTVISYIMNVFVNINCSKLTMVCYLIAQGQNISENNIKLINTYFSQIYVLSLFGKKICERKSITSSLHIMSYGFVNNTVNQPMDKILARTKILEHYSNLNFGEDFVIYSNNPNTFVSRLDILIHSYIYFIHQYWKEGMRKPLLILDFSLTKNEWNIADLFSDLCQQYSLNLDINKFIMILAPSALYCNIKNLIYNSVDVGITTNMSGGMNQCMFEHAGIGRPQIITSFGDLAEIFDEGVYKVPITDVLINPINMEHYKIVNYRGVADAINYYYNLSREDINKEGNMARDIVLKYKWSDTNNKIKDTLTTLYQSRKEIMC